MSDDLTDLLTRLKQEDDWEDVAYHHDLLQGAAQRFLERHGKQWSVAQGVIKNYIAELWWYDNPTTKHPEKEHRYKATGSTPAHALCAALVAYLEEESVAVEGA